MINFQLSINEVKSFILDFLFPKYCVNCNREISQTDSWVCLSCAQKIVPVVSQVCPACGRLTENGRYCPKCSKDKSLIGVMAAAYFDEGPIREMIHNFKYNGVLELGDRLAEMMVDSLNNELRSMNHGENKIHNSLFMLHDSILTFVPMHWQRKAKRGYNQAEVLARIIGQKLNIEVCELLTKPKKTKRQAELSGNSRRKNLQGTFILNADCCVKNREIIIVDDVVTTGSTLNECAAVLKKAGAKKIWGLVISRG